MSKIVLRDRLTLVAALKGDSSAGLLSCPARSAARRMCCISSRSALLGIPISGSAPDNLSLSLKMKVPPIKSAGRPTAFIDRDRVSELERIMGGAARLVCLETFEPVGSRAARSSSGGSKICRTCTAGECVCPDAKWPLFSFVGRENPS